MSSKFKVKLTPAVRRKLIALTRNGRQKAKEVTHANILLQADCSKEGPAYRAKVIAKNLHIHERTVHRVRQQFTEEGLEAAIHRRPHKGYKPRKIDGEQEAHLIAICCSQPPSGRTVWTLELLSETLVSMEIVDAVSRSTVHRTLKKTNLNLG